MFVQSVLGKLHPEADNVYFCTNVMTKELIRVICNVWLLFCLKVSSLRCLFTILQLSDEISCLHMLSILTVKRRVAHSKYSHFIWSSAIYKWWSI